MGVPSASTRGFCLSAFSLTELFVFAAVGTAATGAMFQGTEEEAARAPQKPWLLMLGDITSDAPRWSSGTQCRPELNVFGMTSSLEADNRRREGMKKRLELRRWGPGRLERM